MTITSDQIITLAAVIGAVSAIYAIFSKPFKMLKHINHVTSVTANQVKLHGDMISELLDHAITNNNTGKMAAVKKQYDEKYRNAVFNFDEEDT